MWYVGRPYHIQTVRLFRTGSFVSNKSKCVPTVTDTAWDLGLLNNHAVGISFEPSQQVDNTNGELTFGGVDESKFIQPLSYV